MFLTFNQNNSGGSFDLIESSGITHFVVIDADTAHEAIEKAKSIGIYFDGVSDGQDCPCCGDRWHEPYDDEMDEFPSVYGVNAETQECLENLSTKWMPEGKEICIHYQDGRRVWK